MVCIRVPLLLKRNIGVLFGVLRGPRSDVPPPFFFSLLWSVSLFCLVVSFLPRYEALRIKILIMQFSPMSSHFISLRSKYSPQHPVLNHPQSVFFNVRDQVSHPYRTTGKIIVLYILIFMFLDSSREDKRFWTEW
jgi:hypothetical protein